MTTTLSPDHRYTIVSADAHAGGDIPDYRPYLPSRWHDEFDAWAASYVNPFADLLAPTAYRSWDSDRRLAENEADGITAEVLFPNSVPPFFEESSLVALPPGEDDYDRRWAGIQAHNRWLSDFCSRVPGRRGGVAQIFVNRIDDALAEIRWAAGAFSPFAGILLPSIPPGCGLAPLWEPVYEPLWDLCEELGVVINIHGGGGIPDYGEHEVARAIMLIEIPWFSHRPAWHLIFGGVLERHPNLQVALTEQGLAWIPRGLETLDWFYGRMTLGNAAESNFFGAAAKAMSLKPERVLRAQLPCRCELPAGERVRGTTPSRRLQDHVGSRLPPFGGQLSVQHAGLEGGVRHLRPGRDRQDARVERGRPVRVRSSGLRKVGDVIGPTVAEIATPLPVEDYPTDSTCNAFDRHQVLRSW